MEASTDEETNLKQERDEALARVAELERSLDAITGYLAGVGTVYTEPDALAGINNLPAVQEAWERCLG